MLLDVKVIAGAKKNFLKKTLPALTVYLTAPAVDNKANKALVNFLSDQLNVSKSRISILRGLKSRHKTLTIENVTPQDIERLGFAAH